ncbi:hypothetical protein SKAU_G00215780 [Synaphobranchus kaupii]|uniref:Uncharacterized protein n=1 Tax=Synaphobranchus kaupii TaxID=118154 RepID=A0A9Q1F9S7_SYNKA|nr:hypothetical protein SKAU_G00215780 [Synaphobranchus kaupii]
MDITTDQLKSSATSRQTDGFPSMVSSCTRLLSPTSGSIVRPGLPRFGPSFFRTSMPGEMLKRLVPFLVLLCGAWSLLRRAAGDFLLEDLCSVAGIKWEVCLNAVVQN